MGLFYERFTGKPFNEAEVDGKDLSQGEQSPEYGDQDQQQDQQQQASDNNNETNNDEPVENNSQEQPQDNDQQNQENGDEQTPDYGAEDDFNYDDSGNGDQDANDQGGQPAQDAPAEEPVDDIKQQEEDIYSSLTAEQLDIKHEELKNQFLNMFDNVNTLIEKVGNIVITEENAEAIEYVSTTLVNLHDMITDYLYSVYKTKSYTENSINYNRFIAVLHGINKILEEVAEKEDK